MSDTLISNDVLRALDFDPEEEDQDWCDGFEGSCPNTPEWKYTLHLNCAHDGETGIQCQSCKNMIYNDVAEHKVICSDGTVLTLTSMKWERL